MHEIHGGKQTPNAMRADVRARKKRARDPIRARSLARSRASPHADDARALAMFKTKAPAPKTAVKKSAPAKKAPAKKVAAKKAPVRKAGDDEVRPKATATRTTTIATTGRARRRDGARDDAIEWEEYSRRASGGDGATRGGRGDGKAMDARTGTISWRYGLTRATRARDARAARGARRSRTIERERNRGRARGAGRIGGSTRAVGDAGGRDAKTTRRRETED